MLERIPSLGLVSELLAALFSVASYFLIIQTVEIPKVFVVLVRYVFQYSCVLPLFIVFGTKNDLLHTLRSKQKWLVLLRSLLGVSSFFVLLFAFQFIPLADVITISQCTPVFVFFACIMLREVIGSVEIICIICCVVGITLVSRPTFIFAVDKHIDSYNTVVGIALSIAYCVILALVYVIQRILTVQPLTSLLLLGALPVPVLIALALAFDWWRHLPCDQWYVLLMAALFTVVASYFRLLASTKEDAHILSIVKTAEVPLTFLVQQWIISEPLPWTSYAGAALICVCLVAMFGYRAVIKLREKKLAMSEERRSKAQMGFLEPIETPV